MTVIERAIESAKERKAKLEKDLSHGISEGHREKAQRQVEVMNVTIEALEKQRQKQVSVNDEGWTCCSNCGEKWGLVDIYGIRNKFCGKCGQAVSYWEEGGTSE